jgi:hypothetical protein
MSLLDRQKEFTGYLVDGFTNLDLKGFPLKSSCSVTGNFSQENLVQPVTLGVKDHGSDGAGQWRLDRLDGPRGLKGWSASLGLPWDTLKTQAAFTIWELRNDPRYASLVKDMDEATKKIDTLVANFCWIYERPAKSAAHLDKRISHAKSVYAIMSKEQTAKTTTAAGAGAAVVIGTATVANAAQGGSLWMTFAGAAIAAIASVAGPLFSHFSKPKVAAPPDPSPVAEQIDHIDAIEPRPLDDPTFALNAAIARRKDCESALAAAVAVEADERSKLVARIDALRAVIANSDAVQTVDASEGQPS